MSKEEDKEKAIWEFFNIFGAHIIKDALYGGKIEILFYLLTNNENFNYELAKTYQETLNVGGSINGGSASAGVATEISDQIKDSINTNKTISNFNARLIGGTGGISMKDTYDMRDFYETCDEWIDAYNSKNEKGIMVALSNGESLCPGWNLLPSEYDELNGIMKEVFATKLTEANSEQSSRFDYEIDVTREFSGGSGTKNDPYLIEAPEQLKLINNYLNDKNIHFKLINDIKIEGSWIPIGNYIREEGDYFNYYFSGHFDGNNKKITYKIDITKKFNDIDLCYYGLFGAIRYATIENLVITANIKTVDYVPEKELIDIPLEFNPEELAAGALAGFSSDYEIFNCSTTGKTNIIMLLE